MNKYLIDEPTLIILPTLAKKIGLNEAILLQQIHYWIKVSKHNQDGQRWIYNTYADWLEQFPFWSERTLRNIIYKLESKRIVLSTTKFNSDINKTKWYRIDYCELENKTGLFSHSGLLIDESPLIFQPSLAASLGLNEAVFLQQLQYWLAQSNYHFDDKVWIVKSREKWLSEFPFWSESTFKRVVAKLTEQGFIYNTEKYNTDKVVKSRWLSICYEKLSEQFDIKISEGQSCQTLAQNCQTSGQSCQTLGQSCQTLGQSCLFVGSDLPVVRVKSASSSIYTETDHKTEHKTDSLTICNEDIVENNFDFEPESVCQNFIKNDSEENSSDFEKPTEIRSGTKNYCSEITTVSKEYSSEELLCSQVREIGDIDTKSPSDMLPPLKNEITASQVQEALNKFVELYTELVVGAKKPVRNVKPYADKITIMLQEHGHDVIERFFDEVKESDFLLGVTHFKPRLSWLLGTYNKILDGIYVNEVNPSKYRLAQSCNAENKKCEPTLDSQQPDVKCKYCQRWKDRSAVEKKVITPQEAAANCGKNKCVLSKASRTYEHCKFCSQSDIGFDNLSKLKSLAEECFKSSKGLCAVKVLKIAANDYCTYCPGNNPPSKTIKRNEKQEKLPAVIKADRNDAGEIWAKAFDFIEKRKRTIEGRIRKYMPFTTYTEEDLADEALLVAYETLIELIAAEEEVLVTVYESYFWKNLTHRFTKYQTIPAMCDVMGKSESDNKNACVFYEIKTEENDFSEDEALASDLGLELFSNDFLEALFSVLPLEEERVMEFYFELSEYGKLTNPEIALKMGCSKTNVRNKINSAMNILQEFVTEYKIKTDSSLDYIKNCADEFSKKIFPDITSYQLFDIGTFLKRVV